MTTLILGASGATGRLLAQQLLDRGRAVKLVVRSTASLPEALAAHERATVVTASVAELGDAEALALIRGCSAVASCLGHNLTVKGMFLPPRRLVTDALRRFCEAIRAARPEAPVKVVLMSSAGVRNRGLDEPVSPAQRVVVGLIRALVPPHADNEAAAEYLRTAVGPNDPAIEWAAVRPDGLADAAEVTAYETHPSPTRSAIFDAGATSRINVAAFMAALIDDEAVWRKWRGGMPVIYDADVI
jgi:nucleoside-diphosphate-sugar epimerase